MSETTDDRRLRWLRLAAVLVVTGYGLWSVKEAYANYMTAMSILYGEPPEHDLRRVVLTTVSLFAYWSVLVFGLEISSREGRRVWLRPGIVPGVVVVLFTVRDVIEVTVSILRSGVARSLGFWWVCRNISSPEVLTTVSHSAGMAVAAAWLAMYVGKWWRPARTWTDRAGRTLGWYWIAVWLIDPFYCSLV